MTDKPEIKVGQRWVTRGGDTVRILAVDADGFFPIIGQINGSTISTWGAKGNHHSDGSDDRDLISLAPSTVKREVALYRHITTNQVDAGDTAPGWINSKRISEPLTIEFTLLPGESAE